MQQIGAPLRSPAGVRANRCVDGPASESAGEPTHRVSAEGGGDVWETNVDQTEKNVSSQLFLTSE